MDGIETTRKIRETGYEGTIIALTANVLIGNDEMFRKNGFDSFLAKPIGVRQLDDALTRFIRDRRPDEPQYEPRGFPPPKPRNDTSPQLLKIIRGDIERALGTLNGSPDLKLYTTTVHAMKSMAANIGESEISELAASLEKAGHSGDTEFIANNAERLKTMLAELAEKLSSAHVSETANKSNDVAADNAELLKKQLSAVKEACANYDSSAAYEAINLLKTNSWKTSTSEFIDEIDMLILSGDFEEAANKIAKSEIS